MYTWQNIISNLPEYQKFQYVSALNHLSLKDTTSSSDDVKVLSCSDDHKVILKDGDVWSTTTEYMNYVKSYLNLYIPKCSHAAIKQYWKHNELPKLKIVCYKEMNHESMLYPAKLCSSTHSIVYSTVNSKQ